jgi:hypothetical protein
MLKTVIKWLLRIVFAGIVVVGGNVGLYYVWVFIF